MPAGGDAFPGITDRLMFADESGPGPVLPGANKGWHGHITVGTYRTPKMDPHDLTTPGGQAGAVQLCRLLEERGYGTNMICVESDHPMRYQCMAPHIQPFYATGEGLIRSLMNWLGYSGYGKSADYSTNGAYMSARDVASRRVFADNTLLLSGLYRHWNGGVPPLNADMQNVEDITGRNAAVGFLPHANLADIPNNL